MRRCGSCTLCCKLLPTEEIGKPANTRCQHQRSTRGCAIYSRRPMSCQLWSCRWLLSEDTEDQPRPDRSRIVIDMMPDVLKMTPEGQAQRVLPCIVAWIDPATPWAWQDAAFQRYAMRQSMPILLRLSNFESVGVLFPPACTGGDMILQPSQLGQDMPTTLQEKAAALGGTVELPPAHEDVGKAVLKLADGREIAVASNWRIEHEA